MVVVGAGFAGSYLLRVLPPPLRRPGETLLVDRAEAYEFIPLAHEVAVGRIHPESVRSPIAPLCGGRCSFLRAEATGVDLEERILRTTSGDVGYEYLVLAAGSGAAPPPNGLAPHLQTFWTPDDALRLRAALSAAWRKATSPSPDGDARAGDLTVAIVGGGATGVELSAEIATLFQYLRQRSARRPSAEPRVVLIEATDRLMGWLDPFFHEVATESLTRLGVEVRLGARADGADEEGIEMDGERLPAGIRVWTGGISISDLVRDLPGDHDPTGRVKVDAHLTLPGHPEAYVLGDAGVYEDPTHGLLPPVASVAVQQGPWVARDLGRRLRGRIAPDGRPPFGFFNRGYVVSLGPEDAVGDPLGRKLRGPAAQALYRSILLYYLKDRRNRALVGADWAMERTIGRLGFAAGQRVGAPPSATRQPVG